MNLQDPRFAEIVRQGSINPAFLTTRRTASTGMVLDHESIVPATLEAQTIQLASDARVLFLPDLYYRKYNLPVDGAPPDEPILPREGRYDMLEDQIPTSEERQRRKITKHNAQPGKTDTDMEGEEEEESNFLGQALTINYQDYYGLPQRKPEPWGWRNRQGDYTFKYNEVGELQYQLAFTRSELEMYLYARATPGSSSPGREHANDTWIERRMLCGERLVPGKARHGLTLWIGWSPAQASDRFPGSIASNKCRFKYCTAMGRSFRGGQPRVAFDERMNVDGTRDPYHVAGYMHLFCLEQQFDILKLMEDLDVRLDTRSFQKEANHMSFSARQHPTRKIRKAETWLRREWRRYVDWGNYLSELRRDLRNQGLTLKRSMAARPRSFDDSLTKTMVQADVENYCSSGATSRQRRQMAAAKRGRMAGDAQLHLGNLEWCRENQVKHNRRAPRNTIFLSPQSLRPRDGPVKHRIYAFGDFTRDFMPGKRGPSQWDHLGWPQAEPPYSITTNIKYATRVYGPPSSISTSRHRLPSAAETHLYHRRAKRNFDASGYADPFHDATVLQAEINETNWPPSNGSGMPLAGPLPPQSQYSPLDILPSKDADYHAFSSVNTAPTNGLESALPSTHTLQGLGRECDEIDHTMPQDLLFIERAADHPRAECSRAFMHDSLDFASMPSPMSISMDWSLEPEPFIFETEPGGTDFTITEHSPSQMMMNGGIQLLSQETSLDFMEMQLGEYKSSDLEAAAKVVELPDGHLTTQSRLDTLQLTGVAEATLPSTWAPKQLQNIVFDPDAMDLDFTTPVSNQDLLQDFTLSDIFNLSVDSSLSASHEHRRSSDQERILQLQSGRSHAAPLSQGVPDNATESLFDEFIVEQSPLSQDVPDNTTESLFDEFIVDQSPNSFDEEVNLKLISLNSPDIQGYRLADRNNDVLEPVSQNGLADIDAMFNDRESESQNEFADIDSMFNDLEPVDLLFSPFEGCVKN